MSVAAGYAGRKVPRLRRMPSHSPPAGQSQGVGRVSGPRRVTSVVPRCRVTTISQWGSATDTKVPARSLWERQIRSTSGESDGRSSNTRKGWAIARLLENMPW